MEHLQKTYWICAFAALWMVNPYGFSSVTGDLIVIDPLVMEYFHGWLVVNLWLIYG